MKYLKSLSVMLVSISVLALTGCQNLTPQAAATATTAAVYATGRNNPKIVKVMRAVQPAACEIVKNPAATLEDVIGAVENAGGVNSDTKAILALLLTIYQTSTISTGTNQSQTHPYLEAVICPGWAGGLALLPDPANPSGVSQNATPKKLPGKWILVE